MNRAERRRQEKQTKTAKTKTYNFTKDQLDKIIQDKMKEVKREATEEAVNTAMVLLLTLPLEVLMDHYWPKTYAKRLPGFVDYVLRYYEMWQDGELDMDELREDLWKYGGIRLEAVKQG